jgi:predicted amidohydrolase
MKKVRIAAAAYPIEEIATLPDYLAKLTRWVETAARQGAQLLVFPEYGAVEATATFSRAVTADLQLSTLRLQDLLPEMDARLAALAKAQGLFILGPSAPRIAPPGRGGDGLYRNVAKLHSPSGAVGEQQKLILTPWDRDPWKLAAGAGQTVFDTPLGKIGIAICYDIEFPLQVRALVEAGAEIILAPSCTDALSGYWRVRIGSQARALENQCVVVQAPTVGDAPWSPALDHNVGAAGVFGPPDLGFPDTGAIALGELNRPGWTYAEVNLSAVRDVRAKGATRNHAHWAEQAASPPERIELR